MLKVVIPPIKELWDSQKEQFVSFDGATLELEHSLVSVSKWESKWNKSFFLRQEKTYEETIDYIRCMTLTENVEMTVYSYLTRENYEQINKYIEAPMTATTFPNERKTAGGRELITSELIYYWMISLNVPFECQYWHLNRLLTLIKVCNVKNTPPKKMSRREIMSRNTALNEARKAQFHSKG